MTTPETLPCPRCGSADVRFVQDAECRGDERVVTMACQCDACGLCGGSVDVTLNLGPTAMLAIDNAWIHAARAWNTDPRREEQR